MTKKGLGSIIVLSIVTCGIYSYVYIWRAINYLVQENGDTSMSKGGRFGLCFVYAGWIIFGLQASDQLNAIRAKKGLPAKDQKTLFTVLGILCPVAMNAVFQNEVNQLL